MRRGKHRALGHAEDHFVGPAHVVEETPPPPPAHGVQQGTEGEVPPAARRARLELAAPYVDAGFEAAEHLLARARGAAERQRRATGALDATATLQSAAELNDLLGELTRTEAALRAEAYGAATTPESFQERAGAMARLPALEAEIARTRRAVADGVGPTSLGDTRLGGPDEVHAPGDAQREALCTANLVGVIGTVSSLLDGPEPVPPGALRAAAALVDPWRGRPANYRFLVMALARQGLWEKLEGVEGSSGRTLAEVAGSVTAQAARTGALKDVGVLDDERPAASPVIDASADATKLGRALAAPMFADARAVTRALRGKSAAEIAALREAFHQQTGRDLDRAIETLGGEDLDVARYLLRGAPAAVPEPAAPGAPAPAGRAATVVFQALDTVLDDDEDAVFRALAHRTPTEIAEIKRTFQDHYGRDLEARIAEKLHGTDLERARALLRSDGGKAAALRLVERAPLLVQGTKPSFLPDAADGAEVLALLRDLRSDEERASLVAAYKERTGRDVADLLRGDDGLQARALLAGDRATADAIRLESVDLDEDEVAAVLRATGSAEERRRLAVAYRKRTGRVLEADLNGELDDTDRDEALALLAGDEAGAAAARLEDDAARVFATFAGKSAPERQAVVARWEKTYGKGQPGTFDRMLEGELGGMKLERARQLVEHGRVDTVLEARDAMERAGTHEERLKGAFAGMDRPQVADAERRYAAAYDEGLAGRVEGETSGSDEFDVKQAMKGRPRTLDEAAARAAEAWDFERGSGRGLLGGVTDRLYEAGPVLDHDHLRVATLRDMVQQAATPEERAENQAKLAKVLDYHGDDVEGYRSAEERVGSAAQMAAETVAAMGVTAATGGMGGNFAMARLAAQAARIMRIAPGAFALGAGTLVGGGAGMAARRLISGESYGSEDIAIDGAITLANTASAGITAGGLSNRLLPGMIARATGRAGVEHALARRVLDNPFVQTALVHGVQGGASGALDGIVAAASDERAWDEGDAGGMLGTVLRHTVGGVVTGGITGPLDEALLAPARPRQRVARAVLAGATGGVISSGVQDALSPAVWDMDGDAAELHVLLGMSTAGMQGAMSQGARARTKATLQPELAHMQDVAGVSHAPPPGADLVTPGLPHEEIITRLRARQETLAAPLLATIDDVLDDPGQRADLRRRYRRALQAELGAEAAAAVQARLLRERPELGEGKRKGELERLKRAALAKEAAARLSKLSPDEIDERLRARLEEEVHAEVAAATATELKEQLDARTAQTTEAVFEGGAAPLVVDFLVVGRGEPAAASYALEQKRTGGQGLVIADDAAVMGGRTGAVPYGQENQNVRMAGLVVQPDEVGLSPSPGRYGTTGELALASEATLAHAGAQVLGARVVKVEDRPAQPDASWPADAMVRAKVKRRVPVHGTDGTVTYREEEATVYGRQSTTLATGMGPPRRPQAADIGAEEGAREVRIGAGPDVDMTAAEDVLSSLPSFRDADGELKVPEKLLEHGVLVQGGGPSGSWAADEMAKLGIGVTFMGRESPPDALLLLPYASDPELAPIVRELGELRSSYAASFDAARALAKKASKRGAVRGNYLDGDGEDHRKNMAQCIADARVQDEAAMKRLREMREAEHAAMLAASDAKERQLHWRKYLALQQTREAVAAKFDTHDGLHMDRNAGTSASPHVELAAADVVYTETTKDGVMRLYLHDGRIVETGQVLTAIGQDQLAATGLITGKKKRTDVANPPANLRPIENPASGEVYGLARPGGRTRLAGAAATFGVDPKDFADEAHFASSTEFWRAGSIAHGDPDSRGVTVGLRTAVGDRVLGMLVVAKYRELLPDSVARLGLIQGPLDALNAAKTSFGLPLDDNSGLGRAP